jgi:hypothetical protein
MFKEDGWVKPDKRKGQISLVMRESLMHFQWKDRTTGTIEDDLIIFPEEATFYKVEKCTTGRVFLLDFKDSTKLFFYWMQEPNDAKDAEHCTKINQCINNPNAAYARSGGMGAMNLSQLDRNQLLGLLTGFQGQPTPPDSSAQSSSRGMTTTSRPVELSTLQNILSGLNLPQGSSGAQSSGENQPTGESSDGATETDGANADPKNEDPKNADPKAE